MSDLFMVFDVESIGLHGEGFAYGFVVVHRDGRVFDAGRRACDPKRANGWPAGQKWVSENVPAMEYEAHNPYTLRAFFWERWQHWKGEGAVLVADCAWPVEARFLAACVDDQVSTREWQGPYPLHELASFMVAAGMDPGATYDRLPSETLHDPLGDARQSARLLLSALAQLRGEPAP